MADPVNLADVPDPVHVMTVLAQSIHGPDWDGIVDLFTVEDQANDLLRYGGGDPVVVMPDGTLRRAVGIRDDWVSSYVFTDPVAPDA